MDKFHFVRYSRSKRSMRIQAIQPEPLWTIPYQFAGPGGLVATAQLPILVGTVDALPDGLQALVCFSDLQGVEVSGKTDDSPRLLGQALAEELRFLAEVGEIPPAGAIGILMAGDLYATSTADKRGAEGDVLPVWRAFHDDFRWVAGVAGNHDTLDEETIQQTTGMYYLDGTSCIVDNLRVAGISGVVGNPTKRLRRSEAEYVATIRKLARKKRDILILHESPAIEEQGFLGSPAIREALEAISIPLVICGHTRWPQPLVELSNGCQVQNVDSRTILLTVNGSS